MPKVIQVVESEINRGSGKQKGERKYPGGLAAHTLLEDDSVRMVKQYHTLDGEFLAEVDPRHEKLIDQFNKKEEENK